MLLKQDVKDDEGEGGGVFTIAVLKRSAVFYIKFCANSELEWDWE